MSFEEIVRYLSAEDQKIVAQMVLYYEDIDRQTAAFAGHTGLRCKPLCKDCCENPGIETTLAEVLPLAVWLWSQSKAQDALKSIEGKDWGGLCIFYNPLLAKEGEGCCSVYPWRPGICRLFGFSGNKDKYGHLRLSACRVMKEFSPKTVAETNEGVAAGKLGIAHALAHIIGDTAQDEPKHGPTFVHAFLKLAFNTTQCQSSKTSPLTTSQRCNFL